MNFEIPKPLKVEHYELHAELVRTTEAGGRTGDAAKTVAKLLHPHFVKEEEYALPPLALLVALSQSKIEVGMADVLLMTDRLKPELSTMLAEHKEFANIDPALICSSRARLKPK